MPPCLPSGASSDPALEERIHAVLGLVGKEVREDLLFKLVEVGGPKSLPLLTSILAGDAPSTAGHRQAAVQAVHKIIGVEGIHVYRAALTDRDFFVQLLALAALRCDDHNGQAASGVEAWVTRRLKGRKTRKTRAYQEIPLAVGYFSSVRQLETIAKLLNRYEDQLNRTDRHMLEHIWSVEDRRRWAQAETAGEPDLTGMGYLGFSDDFVYLMQCEAEGIEPAEMRSGEAMTAEEEALFFNEWHQHFLERLARLERRQSATQG